MGEEIERILNHPLFRENIELAARYEKERTFCHHDLEHALSVARIAYILVLEQHLPYRREMVYAAGLLHDIGRAEQYASGVSHRTAGAEIAGKILTDAGFSADEIAQVQDVIARHGGHRVEESCGQMPPENLLEVFALADFWSRNCRKCPARGACYWDVKCEVPGR